MSDPDYYDDIRTAVVHDVQLDFESLREVVNRTRAEAVRDELQATLDTVLQPAVDRVLAAESAAEILLAAEDYADKHRLFVMEKVQGDRQERLLKRCDAMAAALRSYRRIDLRAAEQLRRFAEDLVRRLDHSATVRAVGALVTQLGQLATQEGQLATQLGEYTTSLQSIIDGAQHDRNTTAGALASNTKVLEKVEHTLRRSMEELVGPFDIARDGDEAHEPGQPEAAAEAGEPEAAADEAAAPVEAHIEEVLADAN